MNVVKSLNYLIIGRGYLLGHHFYAEGLLMYVKDRTYCHFPTNIFQYLTVTATWKHLGHFKVFLLLIFSTLEHKNLFTSL